jgi:hypothetical protein
VTDILNVPMRDNDAGAKTIGEYLLRLLVKVWDEDEGFSGKRPFGNSGWTHDLYSALAEAGIIEAEKDVWDEEDEDYGWEWTWDYEQQQIGHNLIKNAIKELFSEQR